MLGNVFDVGWLKRNFFIESTSGIMFPEDFVKENLLEKAVMGVLKKWIYLFYDHYVNISRILKIIQNILYFLKINLSVSQLQKFLKFSKVFWAKNQLNWISKIICSNVYMSKVIICLNLIISIFNINMNLQEKSQ